MSNVSDLLNDLTIEKIRLSIADEVDYMADFVVMISRFDYRVMCTIVMCTIESENKGKYHAIDLTHRR